MTGSCRRVARWLAALLIVASAPLPSASGQDMVLLKGDNNAVDHACGDTQRIWFSSASFGGPSKLHSAPLDKPGDAIHHDLGNSSSVEALACSERCTYAGTAAGDVFCVTKDGPPKLVGSTPPELSNRSIEGLATTRNGIWVATAGSLFYGQGTTLAPRQTVDGFAIESLFFHDNQLWIGSDKGLFRFKPADETVDRVALGGKLNAAEIKGVSILDDSLWLATKEDGLFRVALADTTAAPYKVTLSSVVGKTSSLAIALPSLVLVATRAGLVAFDGAAAPWDPAFKLERPRVGSLKAGDQLQFHWSIGNFGRRSSEKVVEQIVRLTDRDGHDVVTQRIPPPGSTSWTTVAPDASGTYTFTVSAIDVAGRESVRSQAVPIRIGVTAGTISPAWMLGLGVPAAIVGFLGLLLWVSPFTLARMERRTDHIVNAVSAIPGGAALKPILAVTLVPWFARHPRTLDAWIEHHSTALTRAFEHTVASRVSGGYVALPVRIGNATEGEAIDAPTPQALLRLLTRPRFTLEIVGGGGAGKTTLASQIGRWALTGGASAGLPHRMLPVFIDEETTDVVSVIRRKLNEALDQEVSSELTGALLRRQRLVVIVDRLSERTQAMRDHVRTLQGNSPVRALIVTTRSPTGFDDARVTGVYPQPLDSAGTLRFMTVLLSSADGAFRSIDEQLELGGRLKDLLQLVTGERLPVTPLLVKLYVDRAIALVRERHSLDQLPSSVPEVYFDFVRGVNPQGVGGDNVIPDQQLIRGAMILGMFAVREPAFVPRDFTGQQAGAVLVEAGWTTIPGGRLIDRLRANGILLERLDGPDAVYRFALDPVAEFLAAYLHAELAGTDPQRWSDLVGSTKRAGELASGFRNALKTTLQVYGPRRGWADVGDIDSEAEQVRSLT